MHINHTLKDVGNLRGVTIVQHQQFRKHNYPEYGLVTNRVVKSRLPDLAVGASYL